jgi:hypothetical protein
MLLITANWVQLRLFSLMHVGVGLPTEQGNTNTKHEHNDRSVGTRRDKETTERYAGHPLPFPSSSISTGVMEIKNETPSSITRLSPCPSKRPRSESLHHPQTRLEIGFAQARRVTCNGPCIMRLGGTVNDNLRAIS